MHLLSSRIDPTISNSNSLYIVLTKSVIFEYLSYKMRYEMASITYSIKEYWVIFELGKYHHEVIKEVLKVLTGLFRCIYMKVT